MRQALRAEHYDVCIDLQGAVRSALAGRLAGAPRMIGEDQPREWAARWLFSERVRTQGVHVIEQAVEVCAAAAGEPLSPILPSLPVDREAELWADEVLQRSRPSAGGSAQPGRRMGRETLACRALWSGGQRPASAWLHGAGQCRPRGAGHRRRGGARQWRGCPGAGVYAWNG